MSLLLLVNQWHRHGDARANVWRGTNIQTPAVAGGPLLSSSQTKSSPPSGPLGAEERIERMGKRVGIHTDTIVRNLKHHRVLIG